MALVALLPLSYDHSDVVQMPRGQFRIYDKLWKIVNTKGVNDIKESNSSVLSDEDAAVELGETGTATISDEVAKFIVDGPNVGIIKPSPLPSRRGYRWDMDTPRTLLTSWKENFYQGKELLATCLECEKKKLTDHGEHEENKRKREWIAFADENRGPEDPTRNIQTRVDALHEEDINILNGYTGTRIDALREETAFVLETRVRLINRDLSLKRRCCQFKRHGRRIMRAYLST